LEFGIWNFGVFVNAECFFLDGGVDGVDVGVGVGVGVGFFFFFFFFSGSEKQNRMYMTAVIVVFCVDHLRASNAHHAGTAEYRKRREMVVAAAAVTAGMHLDINIEC
jgi:hypothetical protein